MLLVMDNMGLSGRKVLFALHIYIHSCSLLSMALCTIRMNLFIFTGIVNVKEMRVVVSVHCCILLHFCHSGLHNPKLVADVLCVLFG